MTNPELTPWTRGNIEIPRTVLERVFDEARASYRRDEESCGLLFGPATEPLLVDAIMPMENRANRLHALDPHTYSRTARMYFDLDPLKFASAIHEGERALRPAKVLYHSHLDAGAYFSETDAAAALGEGDEPLHTLAYLVTSIMKGVVAEYRLFVWSSGTREFVASPLRIVVGGADRARVP